MKKRHVIVIHLEGEIEDIEDVVDELKGDIECMATLDCEIIEVSVSEIHPDKKLLYPDTEEARAQFQYGLEQGKKFKKP